MADVDEPQMAGATRMGLGLLAVLMWVAAIAVFLFRPDSGIVIALAAIGAVMMIIAANGQRLSKFSVLGNSAEFRRAVVRKVADLAAASPNVVGTANVAAPAPTSHADGVVTEVGAGEDAVRVDRVTAPGERPIYEQLAVDATTPEQFAESVILAMEAARERSLKDSEEPD